jgi:hypothetical protein
MLDDLVLNPPRESTSIRTSVFSSKPHGRVGHCVVPILGHLPVLVSLVGAAKDRLADLSWSRMQHFPSLRSSPGSYRSAASEKRDMATQLRAGREGEWRDEYFWLSQWHDVDISSAPISHLVTQTLNHWTCQRKIVLFPALGPLITTSPTPRLQYIPLILVVKILSCASCPAA